MSDVCLILECCVWGFFLSLVVSPFVISLIKHENVKQVILHYVEEHKGKSGTPTMGGIIFLIAIPIVALVCLGENSSLAKVSILIFVAYGIVGFLDDFLKIKFKRNLGLRAYQKIIFQLAISILAGFFVYNNSFLGGTIIIPFTKITVDIGWWIIPLVAIVFLATTNSVNLTDGLDGLAGSTTFAYLISFIGLIFVLLSTVFAGSSEVFVGELKNMAAISSVAVGVLLAFLVFNCFPAKIFMGDTGSLALGSLVACTAVMTKTILYLLILGLMFVASSVSVIIQVAYYKLTKKRVFLMAPLHHHFQKKGVHEVRITVCYFIITLIIGVGVIIANILI